jgi:chromatin assembly factor 1 subunit B
LQITTLHPLCQALKQHLLTHSLTPLAALCTPPQIDVQPVVVARFCPILFERDDGIAAQRQQQQQQQQAGEDAAEGGAGQAAAAHPIDLPYKMVLAVRLVLLPSGCLAAVRVPSANQQTLSCIPISSYSVCGFGIDSILLASPALVACPAQVATLDSVVLYDTQSTVPLAVLGHLHYDSITDLAWSSDGQYLAVSSRDCYCR